MAQFHLRLPDDDHEKLKELAKKNNLNLNQIICQILSEYLDGSSTGNRTQDDVLLSRIIKLEQTDAEVLKYVIHTNVALESFLEAMKNM